MVFALFLATSILTVLGTVAAQDDAPATLPSGEGMQRVLTVAAVDSGVPTLGWDTLAFVVKPGDQVTLIADLSDAELPHNLHIGPEIGKDPDFEVTYTPAPASPPPVGKTIDVAGREVRASFTAPDDFESTNFWCTLHPTMKGILAAEAVGAPEAIHHLGVNFLAYWVGLIAFAVLFLVYGITFFLFKYGETSATTDQWDRSGAGAPEVKSSMSSGNATLVAIVIAVAALAGIIYVARMG